ncbi:MAG: hypothetical protein WB816_02260 [Methylocystis sp.]
MFGSVFGGVKQAILILEKLERLSENIKKLTEKIESIELRVVKLEHGNELAAVRSEALVDSLRGSTTAVVERAAAHHYGAVIERIIHVETRLAAIDGNSRSTQIGQSKRPDHDDPARGA